MRHSIEYEGDILVATLRQPWVNEPHSDDIHREIKAELDRGARRVLIDLEHCRFATSGGVGVSVAILTSVRNLGGSLKLSAMNDRVRRSFVVSGIWRLFEPFVYQTKEGAMAAFREEALHPAAPGSAV